MIKKVSRNSTRVKRHLRVRKNLAGSGERPRLVIYRSLNHVYVQVIDDSQGNTLVAASSLDPLSRDRKCP